MIESDAVYIETILRATPAFSNLSRADRTKIAVTGAVRSYLRGAVIFEQEAPAEAFYTVISGLVKVYRLLPTGKQLTLDIFGPGAPIGALAAYDGRPFPATAASLAETTCLVIPRDAFFRLLEEHPTLVRGLLHELTARVVELLNRVTDLTGRRVEPRFAQLFLNFADSMGRQERCGTLVPLTLSRQELADMTGTRIETCIRIMSRWGKDGVLKTQQDGFLLLNRPRLEDLASE